ncbi:MAG: hypothetical protein CSB44_12990 [Gammaproteobacteria bacterium]|nr:MAG: hypothetical protein CSB44_12990 [Gammaproteobacteria bacterium]
MARQARLHKKNATYFVTLRAKDGERLFRTVADRRHWEALIAEGAERFDFRLQGYCWLDDAIFMVLKVGEVPLSRIMQNLSFRYTRNYNAEHGTSGPLFRGRYRALMVEPGQYLADLVRYLHNAPVRAGKARSADTAKWTSHAAYLGRESREWLDIDTLLAMFGKSTATARRAFRRHVDAGRDEAERVDIERGTAGGRLLGSKRFMTRAVKPGPATKPPLTLVQLVRLVCREEGVREKDLKSPSRARAESQIRQIIAYLATEHDIATLSAVGDRFNRDLTTMSRNQRYFRERLAEDAELKRRVQRLDRKVRAGN